MINADVKVLASRIEASVGKGVLTSKRMFGGITYLHRGNMLCSASPNGLMVRVGAEAEQRALAFPHTSPCMGAGHLMAGFIMIDHPGIANSREERHRSISLERRRSNWAE